MEECDEVSARGSSRDSSLRREVAASSPPQSPAASKSSQLGTDEAHSDSTRANVRYEGLSAMKRQDL